MFGKICHALFSCNIRFEIRPFALLTTKKPLFLLLHAEVYDESIHNKMKWLLNIKVNVLDRHLEYQTIKTKQKDELTVQNASLRNHFAKLIFVFLFSHNSS